MSLEKHGGHVVFSWYKLDLEAFGTGRPIIKHFSAEVKKK